MTSSPSGGNDVFLGNGVRVGSAWSIHVAGAGPAGSRIFLVHAVDNRGLNSASIAAQVAVVAPVNQAPKIGSVTLPLEIFQSDPAEVVVHDVTDPDAITRVFAMDGETELAQGVVRGNNYILTFAPYSIPVGEKEILIVAEDAATPRQRTTLAIKLGVLPENHAPAIDPLSTLLVLPGETAQVAIRASDSDEGQTLTFALGTGVPLQASIDANSGAFSWPVPAQQAPGNYDIMIWVTDDGSPTKSAFAVLRVQVRPPNQAPVIIAAASASPTPVIGTTATLRVMGQDDAPEEELAYRWRTLSKPADAADPNFSLNNSNAAKTSTVTFVGAGVYTFGAIVTDAIGLTVSSNVTVTVKQTFTSIAVTPQSSTMTARAKQQFTAAALDQFNAPLATQPKFAWKVTQGSGSIGKTGLFTSPTAAGLSVVTATSGSFSAHANVTTVTIPATPSNLIAKKVDTRVQLTWTDKSINETGFRIQMSTDGLNWSDYATIDAVAGEGEKVSFTTGPLPLGRRYFRLIAFNNLGNSKPSSNVAIRLT